MVTFQKYIIGSKLKRSTMYYSFTTSQWYFAFHEENIPHVAANDSQSKTGSHMKFHNRTICLEFWANGKLQIWTSPSWHGSEALVAQAGVAASVHRGPGERRPWQPVSLQPRGEKYSLFFPDYGLLEISFESPFAGDLLKYCLATKPYANNVLSPVLAFY